jgi:hypothetical protein
VEERGKNIGSGHSTVTTIPVVAKLPAQWTKEKSQARLAGVRFGLKELRSFGLMH